jgi:hypothetical protein
MVISRQGKFREPRAGLNAPEAYRFSKKWAILLPALSV